MKPRLKCILTIGFALVGACSGSSESESPEEEVYEHMYETTSADMQNTSRPFNLTEEQIKATPEYRYRMVIILTLQLYWAQSDHAVMTRSKHERFFVAKDVEIPHMNDALNETHSYVWNKTMPIQDLYQEIYDEKVTWTEKMTKMPIEQETVDELVRKWKKIEQMFEEHYRQQQKIPKDIPIAEIEAMGKGMKVAVEELLFQYETIQKRMRRVLKMIKSRNIEIFPESATEHKYDKIFEEVFGVKYTEFKATNNRTLESH